jgi:5-methylcytosine-specific restriction endonuclease McrA
MPHTLNTYLATLGDLSDVKTAIIRRLWGSDSLPFLKPWVRSSELLALTEQKYFDRRTRELRDQLGCDIETEHVAGEHSYRLRSDKLNDANPRLYLSASEKGTLFKYYNFKCQICGKLLPAGVRGLQADHKVPLIRGGSHQFTNWQPVCNECNVGKRGACAGCEDDCHKCPWAFPEKVGRVTLVRLPPDVLDALNSQFGDDQTALEKGVIALLKQHLKLR